MTKTTYTQLRSGDWGLRGSGLVAGASVTVSKKNGETKTETVGKIVWEGNGVQLATIARAAGHRDARGRHWNPDKFNGYGRPKGGYQRLDPDDECEMCGRNKYTCGHCIGW